MSTPPPSSSINKKSLLFPFIMVTSLFLLWGTCHAMLDVLNKHFQDALHLSLGQSGFIQSAAYVAYFCMAIPASLIAKRFSYKNGILAGLGLVALGAALFIPCALVFKEFIPFLIALFILFSGLTFLETTANPYATVLGPPETAASRLVLSQSFNGVGWVVGPLIGGLFILSGNESAAATSDSNTLSSLVIPYAILAGAAALIACVFFFIKLPDIDGEVDPHIRSKSGRIMAEKPLIKQPHFTAGVLAQFSYVGAQCAIFAYTINYFIDNIKDIQQSAIAQSLFNVFTSFGIKATDLVTASNGLTDKGAAYFFSFAFILFTLGRFSGSVLLRIVPPATLLGIYALLNMAMMAILVLNIPNLSFLALLGSFFFMSIMFPTIFSISLHNLGAKTKIGASLLVMSIIGGAVTPPLMGFIVSVDPKIFKDTTKAAEEMAQLHTRYSSELGLSFLVPLVLFGYIAVYSFLYPRLQRKS